ncbi:hypothetical protein ACWENR_26890 [Micromonospora sp. NPDC004336]
MSTPDAAARPAAGRGRAAGPGRVALVLAVVVALLLCGLAGALAGGVAGTLSADPAGPTAPPSMDADFPSADRRYLPGVRVATIADGWLRKSNSYTCAPADRPARTVSEAAQRLECTAPGALKWDLTVDIEFDGETQVRYVRADCALKRGAKVCGSLFATMADALLSQDAELRRQAYEWAAKNAETDEVTTIGGIRFSVRLEPRSITAEPAL